MSTIKQEIEKNKIAAQLIKTLITHLPRYAEEEGDFYAVKREDLINALCSPQVNQAVAENTVYLIENLLDTLAVLNVDYLAKGEWCFISFPAQLLALSVLTAMSDKGSRLLADNFWNTQAIADDKKNNQRDLLRYIESNRVDYHASGDAPPIRYIYVAWSIIKLDDKILFYQREDTHKRFDKTAWDYGLVGGRLNQRDIVGFTDNKQRCLQAVQSSNSDIKSVLPETLKRELKEEAGLIFDTHYTFTLWRSLKPYRQVQGSAPNHAFTEYYLDVFHINLTLAGYIHLCDKITADNRLVWFSLDEIEKGITADGKIAYIKALVNDFDKDRAALKNELMILSDSFTSGYLFKPHKYGITLLQHTDKPLYAGILGKEKIIDVCLTVRQQAILWGLAAHNRGFTFISHSEDITLHPYGWIEVKEYSVLQNELIALAVLFTQTDFKIESQQDKFFRWSIEPSILYVDNCLFTYYIQQADLNGTKEKINVRITRAALSSAFGEIADNTVSLSITLNLAHGLHKLAQQVYRADHDEARKIQDNYEKSAAIKSAMSALALKGLLRRKEGDIQFCVAYQVD
ncbi:MAG: NUDIX domain-containing protein [Methylococcales bacterium]|nr:NUDIX domain-containing protein [Methylococcales bacterium]